MPLSSSMPVVMPCMLACTLERPNDQSIKLKNLKHKRFKDRHKLKMMLWTYGSSCIGWTSKTLPIEEVTNG